MSKPYISFKNVQKSYDGRTLIVDNLNLDINQGEFVSLLGPSGSGKTTCLMMLAGFETVTGGEILIDNTPIQNIPPNQRNIGMVFQNYALFPHMTVAENLAFPLEIRKQPKTQIDKRVQEVLAMVRLQEFGNRRIAQLSGGQQQRVAVARALTFNPEIVLMDEPLGALDKNLREEMQFEIKHIHDQLGITIVYVTHDQSEAITMSDRVAVFNDGAVQQFSDPETLYEYPENAFVANFIGETTCLTGVTEANSTDGTTQIKVNNQILTGRTSERLAAGDAALLSVRPEKVKVNPEPSDSLVVTEGSVLETIYMGDHMRLRLNVLDHDQFIVKILNNQKPIHVNKGEKLQVGWEIQHCCVLKA